MQVGVIFASVIVYALAILLWWRERAPNYFVALLAGHLAATAVVAVGVGALVARSPLVLTVLTLVLVPGTFSLALGVESRMGPRLRRWLTTGGAHAPAPVPQAAE